MTGLKVLFLDVDEVLQSARSAIALGQYANSTKPESWKQYLDPIAVGLVSNVCSSLNLSVILASTWRKTADVNELGKFLSVNIIDCTPVLASPHRGHEIQAWLDQNSVNSYAILDNDTNILPEQLDRYVQVDPMEGVSMKNVLRICELFNAKPYDLQNPKHFFKLKKYD